MSASIESMQRKIELLLNEVNADQIVQRVVIQNLLLAIASTRGPEVLAGIRQRVLEGLALAPIDPNDATGSERMNRLIEMRAELFFQDIERGLGASRGGSPEGRH